MSLLLGGNRARFIVSRLRAATLPEVVHRIREGVMVSRCRRQVRCGKLVRNVHPVDARDIDPLELPAVSSNVSASDIEEILLGKVWSLNWDQAEIDVFEARVRRQYFADVRQKPGDPDIRAVWEPARLQHAAALIHHACNSGGSELSHRCREYAKKCILQWIEDNPFLYGPHYKSAMECGLRIPVFCSALKNLVLNRQQFQSIISTIFHHAWWIENRLSLHSSLGNHTVCEALGLTFAGAIFGKTSDGRRWLSRGVELLRQELNHQILPDGGPAEQSLSYHRFVLDIYWLAVDFLSKNSLDACSDLKPRLRCGEEFLAAFADISGAIPAIGDSDDGHAVAPGMFPLREAHGKKGRFNHFPQSGYSVIRCEDAILTFDHGPLGLAPLFNHGHADALSMTLSVKGESLLVDPGTYGYNGAPQWRRYFKGTRAHNTVTIDGMDQAVQMTGFIWSKPYGTELIRKDATNDGIVLEARHNGYNRLKQQVVHKRVVFVSGSCILIKDTFSGHGIHDYELNYHLHPDATATENDGWWQVQKGEGGVFIGLMEADKLCHIHGQDSPLVGWYSPAYGIKKPTGVLQARKTADPDAAVFLTAIAIGSILPPEQLHHLAASLP